MAVSPGRSCKDCGCWLPYSGRGRPPELCKDCRRKRIAAKKRAYYERHKDEIAAQQRAYYERHKDEIAAKKRAYRERHKDEIAAKQRAYRERALTCTACEERLRHPSDSGLCGFCEEERERAA